MKNLLASIALLLFGFGVSVPIKVIVTSQPCSFGESFSSLVLMVIGGCLAAITINDLK